MLTLIKRELESNAVHLGLPFCLNFLVIGILIHHMVFKGTEYPPIGVPLIMYKMQWLPLVVLPLLFAAMGAAQMYYDRSRKISAFLATLATTRTRIFLARLIVGVFFILITNLPLVITDAILLRVYPRLVPIDLSLLTRMFLVAGCVNLAAYAIGLLLGFRPTRFFPVLPALLFCALLLSLIVIKGFAVVTMSLLLIIAAAALARTYQAYTTNPL